MSKKVKFLINHLVDLQYFSIKIYNNKKAAGQLVGVSGRDYRVYFYSTYISQLGKNNKSGGTNTIGNNGNNTKSNKVHSAPVFENTNKNGKKEKSPDVNNKDEDQNKRKRNEKSPGSNPEKVQQSDDSSSSEKNAETNKKLKIK